MMEMLLLRQGLELTKITEGEVRAANDEPSHVIKEEIFGDPDNMWITVKFKCPTELSDTCVTVLNLSIKSMNFGEEL